MRKRLALVEWLVVGWMIGCSSQAGKAALEEPVTVGFESPLDLIVIEAQINGEGPFRFPLDSGTPTTVIDAALARRLNLAVGSETTRGGTVAGSRVTSAPVQGGVAFELAPGFEVQVDTVIAAPVTQASRVMLGEHVDGILGSAVFFQHVVEVDYERRRLTFHDADRYRYDGSGSRLDLHFRPEASGMPFLRVSVTNRDVELEDYPISIDSGGMTFGIGRLARREHWDRLIHPTNRVVEVVGATGLSDEAEGVTHGTLMAQMDRFVMGPFAFEAPVITYSAGSPTFASMGASLLHRFTAVFDYRRKQLILEPNARFDDPPNTDQSGLLLIMADSADDVFEVFAVSPGTPADEAGLERGDRVVAVDGVPASAIGLNGARLMFCRAKAYRLDVRRDGQAMEIVMVTRPLF